jgi:26S proteasome regulatory subunit T2
MPLALKPCFLITVTPHTQCRLKLLKLERIKDYLLMEEEFIRNQEQMKPLEEKQEVSKS